MVDFPFFISSAEDDTVRIKRMIRETKAPHTTCPLCNCEKRGVFVCEDGCSWVLDEEQFTR